MSFLSRSMPKEPGSLVNVSDQISDLMGTYSAVVHSIDLLDYLPVDTGEMYTILLLFNIDASKPIDQPSTLILSPDT